MIYKIDFLKGLYSNVIGRFFIYRCLYALVYQKWAGGYCQQNCLARLFLLFCKSNHIDLSIYDKQEFDSYNDFFYKKTFRR